MKKEYKPYIFRLGSDCFVTVQAQTEFDAREAVQQWLDGNEEYRCR